MQKQRLMLTQKEKSSHSRKIVLFSGERIAIKPAGCQNGLLCWYKPTKPEFYPSRDKSAALMVKECQ
jgi:hypothetical protein